MSEKLIPFNWDEFVKDPSRLRQVGGLDGPPTWAEPLRGNVVVMWRLSTTPLVYWGSQFSAYLRLAAKTRKVGVRLFQNIDGDVFARTSDGVELDQAGYVGNPWVSEIIEIEVEA